MPRPWIFTGWIFIYSGPKVQAEAYYYTSMNTDKWVISLKVWNTGRQDAKIKIIDVYFDEQKKTYRLKPRWDGPETPMMLAAHSWESWHGVPPADVTKTAELPARINKYTGTMPPNSDKRLDLFILLEVGGKRGMKVPTVSYKKKYGTRGLTISPSAEPYSEFPH